MRLTGLQKDLIFGTLLGDGNLQTNNGQTWRYRALHKAAHHQYILSKYTILKDYCSTGLLYSIVPDKRTEKCYYRYYFNTLFSDEFKFFGQLFYRQEEDKSWKKFVPKNVQHFLNPRILAYWYMDDGALKWKGRSNAVRLRTDSFSEFEVLLLQKALQDKFSLKVSVVRQNSCFRLCILEESYLDLKSLVLPYLEPSMYYKFPDGHRGVYQDEDLSDDIYNKFGKE